MIAPIIDAHIHFDQYKPEEQNLIIEEMEKYKIDAVISVSMHLSSAKRNLALHQSNAKIKPAFGFHPEQPLPEDNELADLFTFIENNYSKIIAIGEVGLPYYSKIENPNIQIHRYIELLEEFIKLAAKLDKPVALHAIYDDAPIVVNLLEKYSIKKAHFHWFKGDKNTIEQMIENGYYISFTPDLLYEKEIQEIAGLFPLSQVMVETDGPWPFEGPFQDKMTHPKFIHDTIRQLARIKNMTLDETYKTVYFNTKNFYNL